MRLLDKAQANLLRQENGTVRAILTAYEQARKELLAQLTDAFTTLGPNPEPAAVRRLANQAGLVRAIDMRLIQLQAEVGAIMSERLQQIVEGAGADVLAELALLAEGAGVSFFPFVIDDLLELTIVTAVEQVPAITGALASQLIAGLRTGLAEGERFRELVARLYSPDAVKNSIFRRGKTSVELFVRRAVIQANNNSRLLHLEQAKGQLPQLQKQAVAAIKGSTTKLCLRAHGQIQPLDRRFRLQGSEPKPFARRMMGPPFHWNCRTSVVGYLPQFESSSTLTTAAMQAAARQELERR